MVVTQLWKTEPLQLSRKIMEMLKKRSAELWQANERGELVVAGFSVTTALPAGFGRTHCLLYGPNWAKIISDRELAQRCFQTAEAEGWHQNTCAQDRLVLGSILLGLYDRSLDPSKPGRAKPDLALNVYTCESMVKGDNLLARYYGIPYYAIEIPPGPQHKAFFTSQCNDWIEQVAKATGRRYDDEKLIEAVYHEWRTRVLWARICQLQRHVPAPIDFTVIGSLIAVIAFLGGHRKDVADLFQEVLAEMQDRVERKIAMVPTERCRLMYEAVAPWYSSTLLRYPRKYGATYIGSWHMLQLFGAYNVLEDGSFEPIPTLEQQSVKIKSREDALNVLADLVLKHGPGVRYRCLDKRVSERLQLARYWRANGVVFCMDRTCPAQTAGHIEAAGALRKEGIRVFIHRGSGFSPAEFDEADYERRMDSFLESMGLTLTV